MEVLCASISVAPPRRIPAHPTDTEDANASIKTALIIHRFDGVLRSPPVQCTRCTIKDLYMALSLSELKREIEALQERLTKVREYL